MTPSSIPAPGNSPAPETIRIERVRLDLILPLRTEVLRDGQPPESAQFDGDHDAATLHLAAISHAQGDPAVVGCVSLMQRPMPNDASWTHQLRGMAVDERSRNLGIGGQLLAALREAAPDQRMWCNARVPAKRFYERHGWAVVSDMFVVPHHGPHVRMCRDGSLCSRMLG